TSTTESDTFNTDLISFDVSGEQPGEGSALPDDSGCTMAGGGYIPSWPLVIGFVCLVASAGRRKRRL
ncbi:MAG: hypothetical protein KC561_10015, partial [Myxococcales bacterium]|nr:hypothetical protein [Myxococcales bacterium]